MSSVTVFLRVRAVDPKGSLDAVVDVVVEGGRITRVGKGAAKEVSGEGVRVIESPGAILFPGFVDLHAHLREPGQEYKEDVRAASAPPPPGASSTSARCPTPAR